MKKYFKYFLYGVGAAMLLVLFCYARKGGIQEGLSRCEKVPDGYVVVSQNMIDSIMQVANQKPDTVETTKWIKGNPVVVEKIIYKDTTKSDVESNWYEYFMDTQWHKHVMKDDGIDAWVNIGISGDLKGITWGYTPMFKEVEKLVTIKEPYPVVETKIKKIPQRGLYGTMGLGYGPELGLGFSLELTFQQRNGLLYGPQVIQIGDNRFYMGKVGFKIL